MATDSSAMGRLTAFLDRRFLWLLLACYAGAALTPAFGVWMRDVSFSSISFGGQPTQITLPMVMLALLLLNAGLAIRPAHFQGLPRVALLLMLGFVANLL